jgi:hypothetical protein
MKAREKRLMTATQRSGNVRGAETLEPAEDGMEPNGDNVVASATV